MSRSPGMCVCMCVLRSILFHKVFLSTSQTFPLHLNLSSIHSLHLSIFPLSLNHSSIHSVHFPIFPPSLPTTQVYTDGEKLWWILSLYRKGAVGGEKWGGEATGSVWRCQEHHSRAITSILPEFHCRCWHYKQTTFTHIHTTLSAGRSVTILSGPAASLWALVLGMMGWLLW